VPAFWAGGKAWKARYASPVVGEHHFRTECSNHDDAGLDHIAGAIEVTPYKGDNPLYKHGPVRVAADRRHFEHADGTPFFWLGDTWWMGLCHRLHWPEEVKQLAADRKAKGFNVIQLVAGLYPDMPPFDPRGANEAGFPWEQEYARIRPEYFDAADARLKYLVEQGFTPCIVGAWGYFMPWLGVEKMERHWRYLIARYGAMPVEWCAAGEANLPYYLAKGFPYDDRRQVKDWTEVMRYIRKTDPFRRPLTIHPTGIGRLSARNATDDATLLDFDMLQTPHGQQNAVEPTVRTVRESYLDKPVMPVIDGEAAYEMLNDSLPTEWTRQMFWLCMTNGAAGHTYGANGIWQCNREGRPHGPSPYSTSGVGYGKIPWNEAMNLLGSRQVGLGKNLFERFQWWEFTPHSEWAAYAGDESKIDFSGSQWIWFPEGEPATSAPVAKRYFRKRFELPADLERATNAELLVSADDRFVADVNGQRAGEHAGWQSEQRFDVTGLLKPGANVIAIEAENLPTPVSANPAGLIAKLQIQFAGKRTEITSDKSWKASQELVGADERWTTAEFDDSNWTPVKELGVYGGPPWGPFASAGAYGPYAVGIPGEARVIYAPMSRAIEVRELEKGSKYRARAMDPVSGRMIDLGEIGADEKGRSAVKKPAGIEGNDWVLVIEMEK
jgi:hypothetical protein